MSKKVNLIYVSLIIISVFLLSCTTNQADKIRVIIDTDANNELDDQHALAYLFFNGNTFSVKGVTVNATFGGGAIDEQAREAERVMRLCTVNGNIPLYKGANSSFNDIKPYINDSRFDGYEAVNFIIQEASKYDDGKLVLLPIGKLTNVALALLKEPTIAKNIRIVWLGSNYPEPGEYNLENDIPAMNYILSLDVPFEMVTVRYGQDSGTSHVYVTKDEILMNMKGVGLKCEMVEGRHGGLFTCFGDYSVDLFEHCDFYGSPPQRALFDMAAVAILKNPDWAKKSVIPSPIMVDNVWVEQASNQRKIAVWENFDREAILKDFFATMKSPELVKPN